MVCTGRTRRGQTAAERMAEVDAALADLVKALMAGTATAVIGADGSIAFDGWTERNDVTDACAYRILLVERDDWEVKQAIARAEVVAGRSVNVNAINSGSHSHDGGRTWHGGHQ